MGFQPASEAAYVVDEDHMGGRPAACFEEGEERQHAGAVDHAARCAFVTEDLHHLMPFVRHIDAGNKVPTFQLLRLSHMALEGGGEILGELGAGFGGTGEGVRCPEARFDLLGLLAGVAGEGQHPALRGDSPMAAPVALGAGVRQKFVRKPLVKDPPVMFSPKL